MRHRSATEEVEQDLAGRPLEDCLGTPRAGLKFGAVREDNPQADAAKAAGEETRPSPERRPQGDLELGIVPWSHLAPGATDVLEVNEHLDDVDLLIEWTEKSWGAFFDPSDDPFEPLFRQDVLHRPPCPGGERRDGDPDGRQRPTLSNEEMSREIPGLPPLAQRRPVRPHPPQLRTEPTTLALGYPPRLRLLLPA